MFICFIPELGEHLYYHYFELFIGGLISFSLKPFSEVTLILSFGIHSSVSFGLTLSAFVLFESIISLRIDGGDLCGHCPVEP